MSEEENALEDVNQDAHLEEGLEVEAEELEEGEVDSQVENIEEDDVDYASYAKVQGWAPKEKWRGNPDDWVDAKTFVERGREFQSTLKEKNQKLEEKIKEQEEAMKRFDSFTAKQLEKQRKQAIADFKRQQKEALEDGDDDLYEKLEEQKTETLKELNPEKPKPEAPTVPQETQSWMQENPWFGDDPILTDYAEKYCGKLASQGKSIAEQLEETKRYIVEMFPQRFQNQRRTLPTAVSKKVSTGAPKPESKGMKWGSLTESEQKLAQGQMKQFGWTKDEFLKQYSEMENL